MLTRRRHAAASQLGGNGGDARLIGSGGNGGNIGAGATPATPGAGGSGGLLFGLDELPGQ
ncbi:MAG: hypothetical protein ACLPXZ_06495 [Mycobacterium sp.]